MAVTDVRAAAAAVARAVKALDATAERGARANLATARLRVYLAGLRVLGLRLTPEQVAELHMLIDRVAQTPTRATF